MFRALRGMMRVVRHEAYVGLLLTSGTPSAVPRSHLCPRRPRRLSSSFDGVHRSEYRNVLPFMLPRLRD